MSGELLIRDSGAALSFLGSLAAWLPSAPVEDLPRVLDEVGRVKRIADELGDRELTVEASIGEQRVKREIGKRHPRKGAGGRPPAGEEKNLATGREVFPESTIRDYRTDAESATDEQFEAAAEEARETGEPLTRSKVRAAGGAHVGRATGNPEWDTPVAILDIVRRCLGGRIDLDPASSDAAQERVQARRYLTAADDALDPGTKWGDAGEGQTCFLNPPYDAGLIAGFADRLLVELERGSVGACLLLSNNATETKWAQRLMLAAVVICFPAGRIRFLSGGEPRLSPLQGQMLLLLTSCAVIADVEPQLDVTALKELGPCFVRERRQ